MGVLDDLCPVSYPDNPAKEAILTYGWLGCVNFAVQDDDVRAAFEKESGLKFPAAGRMPLDRMIDEATGLEGRQAEYFRAFVLWINENLWGDPEEE